MVEMVSAVNKLTRVTRYTGTATDQVLTSSIVNTQRISAIIKTDISDHFPILPIAKVNVDANTKIKQHILKLKQKLQLG